MYTLGDSHRKGEVKHKSRVSRDTRGKFLARPKRKFMLRSQREIQKALRYMGSTAARIEAPMLHPDHIKGAAILFKELADDLDEIAYGKGTNVNKVFNARVAFHLVNQLLRDHNMSWLQDETI